MKKIVTTTVTYEFERGDRVKYAGGGEHDGSHGTVLGDGGCDWHVNWDGTHRDAFDEVYKPDLRPVVDFDEEHPTKVDGPEPPSETSPGPGDAKLDLGDLLDTFRIILGSIGKQR